MKIIINADDLGANEQVNTPTFELMSLNKITSATLMANGNAIEQAITQSRDYNQCSFGVHLNIVDRVPLSSADGLQDILDMAGNFNGKVENTHLTKKLINSIKAEFCCQIEYLLSHGIKLSHIDSHQHTHTIPALFPIIKLLQKKYNIKSVRLSRNIQYSGKPYPFVKYAKKRIFNLALRYYHFTKTTDGFTDLRSFHKNAGAVNPHFKTLEIMVHPAAYPDEYRLLKNGWESDLPFETELINYNHL